MKILTIKNLLIFLAIIISSCIQNNYEVSGDLKVWHKVEIKFQGPNTFELDKPNPFRDYRLDVVFTNPSGKQFKVPGYYAADGNSAESSSDSGNVWKVAFTPNEEGLWKFYVSFVYGDYAAAENNGGESAGYFDGQTGKFTVLPIDNLDSLDFRSKGKLVYINEPFLQFSGNKEYFIKGGANSPEVFLEYSEFDNTPSTRDYGKHILDWSAGDPIWQNNKGKGIIGSINYLSDLGVNSFYFLTMNAYGDGKNAWPWINKDSVLVYDCSKLDQWGIVFDHMIKKGVMPHFVLTETENESMFEMKEHNSSEGFAKSRKIYFREMVARFGYLCALTWNIGEENGWADGDNFLTANNDSQRKQFAERLRELTYYNDHITVHNGPSWDDHIYNQLLKNNSITGPALQWDYGTQIYSKVLEWRNKSTQNGNNWVVCMDEPWINDAIDSVDIWRKEIVWGTFMAGGAGVELYIGAGEDLLIQDFSLFKEYYKTTTIALNFFKSYVPFWKMEPNNIRINNAWSLILNDSISVLYLKDGGSTSVELPKGNYRVQWFNPRSGGDLMDGTVTKIDGDNLTSIGVAPYDTTNDWVCLISKR